MIGVNISIQGIDELFESLDATKSIKITNKALKAGGEIIQNAIKEAAPALATYDDAAGSNALPAGALKNDVHIALENSRSDDSKKKPQVVIFFGKHTSHVARWLEFGFRHVMSVAGYAKGDNRKLQKAGKALTGKFIQKPFFRAAVDTSKAAAAQRVQEVLKEEIAKAFKNGKAT